jgi:hypothetical protein
MKLENRAIKANPPTPRSPRPHQRIAQENARSKPIAGESEGIDAELAFDVVRGESPVSRAIEANPL